MPKVVNTSGLKTKHLFRDTTRQSFFTPLIKENVMKLMLLAAAMTVSASAFAQMCEVDMVDHYNRVIKTYRAYDMNDGCKEGMKACRKATRTDVRYQGFDCVRANQTPAPQPNPYPNPNPNPRPNPRPNPYPTPVPNPYPGQIDARRMLNSGESAIMNNTFVTVIGVNFNGLYSVKASDYWNTVTNNVKRENLSVTNGCSQDLCTGESVIQVSPVKYAAVVGLSFNGDFVVQANDYWKTISSNISRQNLAKTTGCISSYYAQICTGNTVVDNLNRYAVVVGIQPNGRVVLKAQDYWETLTANVDPSSLVVVR